jgi:hypothetical protein
MRDYLLESEVKLYTAVTQSLYLIGSLQSLEQREHRVNISW